MCGIPPGKVLSQSSGLACFPGQLQPWPALSRQSAVIQLCNSCLNGAPSVYPTPTGENTVLETKPFVPFLRPQGSRRHYPHSVLSLQGRGATRFVLKTWFPTVQSYSRKTPLLPQVKQKDLNSITECKCRRKKRTPLLLNPERHCLHLPLDSCHTSLAAPQKHVPEGYLVTAQQDSSALVGHPALWSGHTNFTVHDKVVSCWNPQSFLSNQQEPRHSGGRALN